MNDLLELAAETIKNGKLVVFPTDTVFGIGCDPCNESAVEKLYALKRRPKEKGIPLLVDGIATAHQLAEIPTECAILLADHWPGALTIVVEQKTPLAPSISSGDTVALRMPAHEDLLELISRVGGALAATSANISGKPSLTTYDEVYATFADSVPIILPGVVRTGVASTIVDCIGPNLKILRKGPVLLEKKK